MNKYKSGNTRQKYGMGWFNESHRHSLARQGIKTGRKIDVRTKKIFDITSTMPVEGKQRKVRAVGHIGVINYGKIMTSTEFRIDDNTTIVCRAEKTSSGFRHIADFYRNGSVIDSAKVTYINRTWEKYDYETVIEKLLDKRGISNTEKAGIMSKVEAQALGKVDTQFKSVAMVASLGDIFGKSPKEKNDWKLRMIKAGLGDKGFEVPYDWETLSEEEKGKRLDKTIELMKKKVNYTKQDINEEKVRQEVGTDIEGLKELIVRDTYKDAQENLFTEKESEKMEDWLEEDFESEVYEKLEKMSNKQLLDFYKKHRFR